jgi:HAD superfamily hydrolase (TIGR01509 family)
VRCVLFDLDGTLLDTWRLYIAAYQRALAPFLGRPVTLDDLRRFKPVSERRLIRQAVGEAETDRYHRAFVAHYDALFDETCEGFYPGATELLAALRERHTRLGMVTGKSRPAYEITQRRCALGPFEAVVTDEDVAMPKPDPEGLRLALAQMHVAPAQAIYVGDSLDDLGAARAAGIAFAAVLWCKGPQERAAFAAAAREGGALTCLETPQALLDALAAPPGAPAPGARRAPHE